MSRIQVCIGYGDNHRAITMRWSTPFGCPAGGPMSCRAPWVRLAPRFALNESPNPDNPSHLSTNKPCYRYHTYTTPEMESNTRKRVGTASFEEDAEKHPDVRKYTRYTCTVDT